MVHIHDCSGFKQSTYEPGCAGFFLLCRGWGWGGNKLSGLPWLQRYLMSAQGPKSTSSSPHGPGSLFSKSIPSPHKITVPWDSPCCCSPGVLYQCHRPPQSSPSPVAPGTGCSFPIRQLPEKVPCLVTALCCALTFPIPFTPLESSQSAASADFPEHLTLLATIPTPTPSSRPSIP